MIQDGQWDLAALRLLSCGMRDVYCGLCTSWGKVTCHHRPCSLIPWPLAITLQAIYYNPPLVCDHRSTTPKFVTPTALSCVYNSWRSTTLSPPKKLTSSTANLEWCHVHFIRDSYSTFIRQVIGPSKNCMELFFNAKFDFKSTWNRDSTTSHHKHPVCQSPAGEADKLTNVWSRYFGTNRVIDNWHRCLGVMWRKRKKYFETLCFYKSMDCQFSYHGPTKLFTYY